MSKQQTIGAWTMGLGQLLLVAMLVLYVVDMSGLAARAGMIVSFAEYLTGISVGVLMQFVGSAIPNMRFSNVNYAEHHKSHS